MPCFICQSEKSESQRDCNKLTMLYMCESCGCFGVHPTACDIFKSARKNELDELRFKMSTLALERKLNGRERYVLISGDEYPRAEHNSYLPSYDVFSHKDDWYWLHVNEFLSDYPQNHEIFDRILLNFSKLTKYPGDQIAFPEDKWWLTCFSRNEPDAIEILLQLEALGLIRSRRSEKIPFSRNHIGTPEQIVLDICLSPKAWDKIHELQKKPSGKTNQAFVAMWFDKSMDDFWERGFTPAIEDDGRFIAIRIDRKDFNGKICDEIIAEIRKSKFLVADFTGQRGGVYYEAGFAHGLGIPVIFTAKNEELEKLHFDTRQFNHIGYNTPEELKDLLRNRIRATIL